MVHSHARGFVGARQNPDTVSDRTVLDLPRGSSGGEQLGVDADLTATTGRPCAQPDVMEPGAINSGFEPCSVERHPARLSKLRRRKYRYLLVPIAFDGLSIDS